MAGRERVLITGASGFLGACLARRQMAAGQEVHLILRPEFQRWRLAGLEGRYTGHWADLRDAAAVRRAVQDCQPEIIYHLATHGAYAFQKDRAAILNTNLAGTANLLEALAGVNYRALVHTGSSSEYGQQDGPMRASDLIKPRTAYAVSKAAATLLCQSEALQGRPVCTVRVFSAYGPWEDPRRLVPYVMECCLRGETPRVTPGAQPRDFIHVDDVMDLLEIAAHCPAARGQILHAGSGRQHTVREMVQTILQVCGNQRLEAQFGAEPTRADEPRCWVADLEETTVLTGWKPRLDLREGIEWTWAWAKRTASARAA